MFSLFAKGSTRLRLLPLVLAASAALVLPAAAHAAAARPHAQRGAGDEFFDARTRERAALQATGDRPARRPTRGMRRARTALERSLGRQGVLDVDPLTGTPRMLGRLDGTLTPPRGGDAATIAQRYVREHLGALGLTEDDLATLGPLRRVQLPGGGEQIRWRQFHAGVPALDNELRVTVTEDGEILNVLGSPQHDLEPALAAPRIDAGAALRAAGATRVPRVASSSSGPQRTTRFATGDRASLVVFGEGDSARLAWQVRWRESSQAVWDAVVDAAGGRVLRRANLVKSFAPAPLFDRHPAAAPTTYDFDADPEGWLAPDATTLVGPNARAWSDVNDNDARDPGEDVTPGPHPVVTLDHSDNGDGDCADPDLPCTWDQDTAPGSWQANREQTTQQAFYYVNRFHDWLAEPAIGFTDFEGPSDRVLVQALDGADPFPDGEHVNNANMYTPPEGGNPVMQMYLFTAPLGRDVSGADDAAIVYHEYTHGLTSRRVTYGDGYGALNAPQSAAMGEGFSDFYAMDYLVEKAFESDTPAPGDLDMGEYSDGVAPLRAQAIDCPVGVDAPRCDGGGFMFSNFGQLFVDSTHGPLPEVHADGEIWAQTLWDLRESPAIGDPEVVRRIVTVALSLAPPEPSFLDMRNAILLADQMENNGDNRDAIWEVFRLRGMGWFASTTGSSDVNPAASDAAENGGAATVTGRVVDHDNARPVTGATLRVGGHDSFDRDGDPFPGGFFSTPTGASGAFSLGPMPEGLYAQVIASAPDGHDPEVLPDVTAPDSDVVVRLKRNWAALAGGASIADVSGVTEEFEGCAAEQAVDQDPGTGFSVANDGSAPAIVVRLPRLVNVTGFAADPGNTCGDGYDTTATKFAIAVSENGATWREQQYTLPVSEAHLRTDLVATAASGRARFVRLRLLQTAEPDADYIDFTDLSVYGNALPVVSLSAPASGVAGRALTLSAAGTQDPDGAISRYEWDIDGNGSADRTTTAASTTVTYGSAASYRPTVTAVDNRGGRNAAARTIVVSAAPSPPPPPPPPPPELDAPVLTLPRSGRSGRLSVRVTCDAACSGRAKLTVGRRMARKLRLGRSLTVGTARVRLAAAGSKRVTVRLSAKVRRALKRRRVRTLKVRLSVTVTDAGARRTSKGRTVRVRR